MENGVSAMEEILKGEETEVQPAVEQTPEPTPAPEPTGEPSTKPVEKVETTPTDTVPDTREVAGLKDAYRAERTKRQEYERKLAEYEAKIQAQKPAEQIEAPKEIDFYDDPKGFFEAKMAHMEQQNQLRTVMIQSEIMARDTQNFPGFIENIEAFKQAATQNPHLVDQMKASPNPAHFAYVTGKNYAEAKLYGGDVNQMIAAKVAEERAKWEADAKKAAENARLDALPKSTSQKPSVGVPPSAPAGATPMDAILGKKPER